eukprot:2922032-Alexandrium_andersonii.AAC.1
MDWLAKPISEVHVAVHGAKLVDDRSWPQEQLIHVVGPLDERAGDPLCHIVLALGTTSSQELMHVQLRVMFIIVAEGEELHAHGLRRLPQIYIQANAPTDMHAMLLRTL